MFLQPYSWTRRLGVGILAALGLLIPTLVGISEDYGSRQNEQVVHTVKGEYHWLLPILDGTGEAGMDLLPGSDFLQALNTRSHPKNTKMLVIAGVMSPLQKDDTRQMVQELSASLAPAIPVILRALHES